ncbi:hypothetical protein JNK13_09455 [bacterium]|nr:hypothetical protein [bacterium]
MIDQTVNKISTQVLPSTTASGLQPSLIMGAKPVSFNNFGQLFMPTAGVRTDFGLAQLRSLNQLGFGVSSQLTENSRLAILPNLFHKLDGTLTSNLAKLALNILGIDAEQQKIAPFSKKLWNEHVGTQPLQAKDTLVENIKAFGFQIDDIAQKFLGSAKTDQSNLQLQTLTDVSIPLNPRTLELGGTRADQLLLKEHIRRGLLQHARPVPYEKNKNDQKKQSALAEYLKRQANKQSTKFSTLLSKLFQASRLAN